MPAFYEFSHLHYLNGILTGHDNGLISFKLERERPAFAVHSDTFYYIRDKYVFARTTSTLAQTLVY